MKAPWRNFLLVVFGISFALQGFIYAGGGINGRLFTPLALLLMWVPGGVALGFLSAENESWREIGWSFGKKRFLAAALFIPILMHLSGRELLIAFGWAVRRPDSAAVSWSQLLKMIPNALITSAFTLGEELGWRGFLQPRLAKEFGFAKGLALLGMVWGYWHFPIIAMGYNFPKTPILGAFVLMPMMSAGMAGFLGWLYARSRTIWAPTLAHAAINVSGGLILDSISADRQIVVDGTMILVWLLAGCAAVGLSGRADDQYSESGITSSPSEWGL